MENLTFRVHSQFQRQRDGYIAYKGEDAPPWADPGVLIVADGLGGTGAIPHKNIRPELFSPELLPDCLFGHMARDPEAFAPLVPLTAACAPAPGDAVWDAFYGYAAAAFGELYAVKGHYERLDIKNSGYFGSRIAASLMLLFSRMADREKVFALAATAKGRTVLAGAVERFLLYNMQRAAEAAGLRYETTLRGLCMLATTLCATLFQDCGECMEALCFFCGDSYPYFWTPSRGLGQLCAVQEAEGSGMTSFLNVTDPAGVHLSCRLRRLKKPVLFLNATDGCYDAAAFSMSPLQLELFLLDELCSAASSAALEESLTRFFDMAGRHDDSSTLSAAAFGFSGWPALQSAADVRRQAIFSRWPALREDETLLTTNYQKAAKKAPAYEALLEDLRADYAAIPLVQHYSYQYASRTPAWAAEKDRVARETAAAQNALNWIEQELRSVVQENFYALICHFLGLHGVSSVLQPSPTPRQSRQLCRNFNVSPLVQELFYGRQPANALPLPQKTIRYIHELQYGAQLQRQRLESLKAQRTATEQQLLEAAWQQNTKDIIRTILCAHRRQLSPELLARTVDTLHRMQELKQQQLPRRAALQRNIWDAYAKDYGRLLAANS